MKKLLSILFLAFLAFGHTGASAQSTTVYYRGCAFPLAHPLCQPGVDGSNPGTSPTSPRLTLPTPSQVNLLPAGSRIRLCNGSAWNNMPLYILQNENVSRLAPLVIEGWDCGDGATGLALLQWPSNASGAMNIGFYCWQGPPTCPRANHGGYVLRNHRWTKAGALTTGSEASLIAGSSRWVLFEGMEIDNWANAIDLATDQTVRNVTIRGNYIHDNSQNGVVGAATDLLIEGNLLVRNNKLPAPCNPTSSCPPYGDTFGLEHALYVGGSTPQQRITIRRNTLIDNSTRQETQQCESGNITARGNVDQMTIEENVITVPNATPFCFGISILDGYGTDQECVRRAVIRGNTIVNVGGTSMALKLTPGGLVENNKIIRTVTTGQGEGISITNPSQPGDAAYCPMGNMTVRHNSFWYGTSTSSAALIVSAGSGHKVYSNAVYLSPAAVAGGATCYSPTAFANFTIWNFNWCDSTGLWSSIFNNLAAARAAGFDINGGNTPTGFTTPTAGNNWLLDPGVNLRGVGRPNGPPRDVRWCKRKSPPDVGAHEFGATLCATTRAPAELQ